MLTPMSSEAYPLLARPITLNGVPLRNRIAHAAIVTRYAKEQKVTQRLIAYHRARIEGGAAATIVEPLASLPSQDDPHRVRLYDDRELDGLKRFADAIESSGGKLIGQIQDQGRAMHLKGRKAMAISASARADDLSWGGARALTTAETADVAARFVDAAARLKSCGWAGIELSAGHGHLIHQFLSARSNDRVDLYGGDLAGRMRFLEEILTGMRQACGVGFMLWVKLPARDGARGGIDFPQAEEIAQKLAAAKLCDVVTFAMGTHHLTLEDHVPDLHWPRAPYTDISRRLRHAAAPVPVAALARLVDPAEAERALADGAGDLVQIGRAFITDAAWAAKALSGRSHDIRSCISCNTCWGRIAEKQMIACDNNPRLGEAGEARWRPPRVRKAKHVVIVGAGPAGLEASWIAAARGHRVTVFSASERYGGKLALLAALPGMDQTSSVYDIQMQRAQAAGASFRFGRKAEAAEIIALRPDTVILATGARLSWPESFNPVWREEGLAHDLRTACETLLRPFPRQDGTALLFDQDATAGTYAAAQLMAQRFVRVIVVTPRAAVAEDESLVVRQGIQRRMAESGIETLPFHVPDPENLLADGLVRLRHVHTNAPRDIGEIAFLAYSTPRLPDDELAAPLLDARCRVIHVGDCLIPRTLLYATAEGHAAGLAV
jgi:2,4-dienoyl-CoA reductase-like NADH-dependent reductase (Old Yellow Enzyme family)